jgi:hypothetical protein
MRFAWQLARPCGLTLLPCLCCAAFGDAVCATAQIGAFSAKGEAGAVTAVEQGQGQRMRHGGKSHGGIVGQHDAQGGGAVRRQVFHQPV